ncbi:aminotransferase class V-fold PLP-dependent enzyme [endosymbiont GvMRE of Glomus versiforme]|uniref:aminotransferase class V-fold PLP-dependent enzyme n=1 Tax=endosymbiont GvMRE of Glomus versiforme TaxID=2039283 RepID=UPI000EB8944D|nr:aminotransferase class V-fold PLP-dependent enzyme [endosymbiont GvMRE of Glomus versiforme]RHZ35507.1 Cysteine desulfurase [endosymbiont GvMRE of Glomus versiforme]
MDNNGNQILKKLYVRKMQLIRNLFPFFTQQNNSVYLDSAATSLKPNTVIQAIRSYYEKYSINSHSEGSNLLAQKVRQTISQTRQLIAEKINADPEEIIFLPSTTYSLNILALSLKDYLAKGDKVFLTHLEHSSNCYIWQDIAQKKEAKVDFLPLSEEFIIDINKLENYIDKKTKIVSFVHMSNSLGVINPVKEISEKIKEINPDCLVIIDACQSIAHLPINVKEWNIDALVFSGHKVYGPTGIGVLWIKKEVAKKLPNLLWGGGKKFGPNNSLAEKNEYLPLSRKFEVGTLPLAQIFGLKAAFEFLNNLDIKEISDYEKKLKNYALDKLKELEKIIIYNQRLETVDIVLFNLKDCHAHDVADYLGKNNICVRAGNFCCPYLKELVGMEAAIRISFFIYNTKEEIDKLVEILKKIIQEPKLLVLSL